MVFARLRHAVLRAGAAASTVLVAAVAVAATAGSAQADAVMISVDPGRTGWDRAEPGLGPSDVGAPDFGQLFATQLDGQIYAQPVVARSTVMVVTETNYAYGLDPTTGSVKWSRTMGPAWQASTIGCGDLTPNIGATATPVVDATTGTAYFTTKVDDGPDPMHPHWYLHGVDITTGNERAGFPATIAGSPANNPTNTFNPATAMQRPGLLLLGGVVYAGFASHCDIGPYVGYVVGYDAATGRQRSMWATETGASTDGAGIWQSGGGLMSDGPGRIFFSTGNGVAPAPGPGSSPPGTLGESVVRLQVNTDGSLIAKDFFSPVNNTNLNRDDNDLGSGSPMAIPDGYGSSAHPHLLLQAGKDGRMFLLDRDNLGGTGQGPGGTDAAIQVSGPYTGVWGYPAFWGGDGGYAYLVVNGGPLAAFKVGTSGDGLPSLTRTGVSSAWFGYTSGSPVVTSDGTTSGSALVWSIYSNGSSGSGGQLRAYDTLPVGGLMTLRYSAPLGNVSKFSVPATDNGKVYVGTRDGQVLAFGRPTTVSLSGSPTDFGSVAVGTSSTKAVTVTAVRPVTVTGVSTSTPFATGSVTLPVSLATGQTLSVPVTFTPTTPLSLSGALKFATSAGTLAFDLHGSGTQDGLLSAPSSLAFGDVPTGGNATQSVSIANSGATSTTITGVSLPASPFSVSSPPTVGATLAPGASVSVPVTFTPTAKGSVTGSLVVSSSTGAVTVPLAANGVTGAATLSVTPTDVDFGVVNLGQTVTKSFDISNTGNLALTLTKAAPPAAPFGVASPVAEGQQLEPGDTIRQYVSFTPTTAGAAEGTYSITGNDGSGPVPVRVHGSGAGGNVGPVVGPAAKCLDVRGGSAANSTPVQLYTCNGTPAQTWTALPDQTLRALGKCLDVAGGDTANGATVQLYDCNGTGAQTWVVGGDGSLTNPQSSRCLDLPGGVPADSSVLQLYDCNGTSAQQWQVPQGIVAAGPVVGPAAKCLDVRGGNPANGTPVQIYTCNGTPAQTWGVASDASLRALGKCLDVLGGGTGNGSTVQLYACNSTGAQDWVTQANGSLVNPQSGRCLDLPGGIAGNGAVLQLYDCNGTPAQQWQLPT